MKKFLTIVMLLLVMVFTGKAQTVLFSENFDSTPADELPTGWTMYDVDGDGYNWYCDTNHAYAYGGTGHLITSASYRGGALTPNNWLVTPAIAVNGSCKLTFQVAGQDPSYAEEHYSVWISTDPDASNLDAYTMLYDETLPENTTGSIQYLGRTVLILGYNGNVHIAFRHHDVTDMFRINFDNIAVSTLPSDPTIACEDTMINFKYRAIGAAFARKSFKLTAYNITTGNVNLAVAAPFTISTDSVSGFGTTLNLQPVNGVINNQVIYVKASSAAAGDFSEYLTISATGAETHSIHLKARVFDCSQPVTLPWDEYFDSGIFPPSCWTLESTATGATEAGYEYTWGNHGSYAVCTGDDEQYQNEKLITPTINLTEETGSLLLSFYVRTNPTLINDSITMVVELQDNGGPWTSIWNMLDIKDDYAAVWNSDWPAYRNTVDLTSYIGHQIKLRFRYIAEIGKACQIWFTAVSLDNFTEPYLAANADTLDFFSYIGEPTSEKVKVSAFNLATPATVTTAAPFELSLDGTTYSYSVNVNNGYRVPVYVRYNPTTETMESGMVFLSGSSIDSTVTDTIVLNGISHDCSDVTLPIVEGFESATGTVYAPDATEYCWHIVYENEGETNNIMLNTPDAAFIGDQAFSFASNFYNAAGVYGQYLISPELSSTNPMLVTFNYAASSAAKPEVFAVGYSTTTRDINAFTWETPIVAGSTDWDYYMNNNVPANTKYVAINYLSEYKQHLYIDNFKIMANPSCLFPMGLTAINTTENTAIIGWDSVNTANAWQIAYGNYPVDIATAVPVDVTSTNYTYTLTGLTANNHYQVYFRTVCGENQYSEWADPIEFYTSLTPVAVPYTMGFEASEEDVENWVLQNANEPNKFIVGTGAHAQGSQRSLYISRDNSANSYVWVVGSGENETNVSNYSTVWAYRDIYFTPTTEAGYLLSFKWRCYGEPDFDFGEVFIGNATAVTNFERNDSIPGYVDVNNSNYTPAGLTKLGRLCGNNTWTTASYILNASEYSGMTKRVYFLWTNDSLSGNNNPLGIDDLSIIVPDFASMTGIVTDGTTQAPIANANITFTSEAGMTYNAVSGNDGTYTITGAITGEYAIVATANGYNPTITSYLVSAGENYIPLTLNKEPCAIVPANVTYEIEDGNMLLYWDQIASGTISQANLSTIESALGVQAATYEMSPYHLFTPADLTTVNGASITTVGMYVVGDPTYCTYTIKFWVGGTGVAADGPASEEPVFELVLTPDQVTTEGWTEVNIEPYKIDGTKCLWIGYTARWENHPDGNCYPCGFTDYRTGEPNNPGYGDVLYFNQAWQTSGYGDWCIRATAQAPDLTYTVLQDGEVLETGITESPYTISPYDANACYKVFTTCENGEVSLPSDCAGGVGVEEFSNESSFSVYPNPATDVVTVSSSMNADRAEILNYLGQVIYSQKVSDNVFTMNVASLADGVYFIRLIGNDGIATQKLIKK